MKTFRDALLAAIHPHGPSLKAISDATGVSYEQLKKLKQHKSRSTNVEDAQKIAAYFGKTLDEFIDQPTLKDHIELASLLSRLEGHERQFLLNAAKAQIDARDRLRQESFQEDE